MNFYVGGPDLEVSGRVKWFDASKGFGFVLSELGGPDILLHANVLLNFGRRSVVEGSAIEILVQDTQNGLQATQVLSIVPPDVEAAQPLQELFPFLAKDIEKMPIEPARVKWFDKRKGFGFATVFRECDDVFIHGVVLRRSGLSGLETGEAIGLRLTDGERGIMAVDIIDWEIARLAL